MKYIFSFTALIDLLSIFAIFLVDIPKSAGVLKILKLLRIVRVLKFSRYFDGIYNFGIAIKKKAKQILISIVILCFLVIIFSILLYGFESGYEGTYFTNGFSGISYCFVMLSGLGAAHTATPINIMPWCRKTSSRRRPCGMSSASISTTPFSTWFPPL